MNHSQSISNLAKAFVQFQLDCPDIERTRKVTVKSSSGNYQHSFAPLDESAPKVMTALNQNGLGFATFPSPDTTTCLLMHTSGEWLEVSLPLNIHGETAHDIGSIITYFRRYIMEGISGKVGLEDDDATRASGKTITQVESKISTKKEPAPEPETKQEKEEPKTDTSVDAGGLNEFKLEDYDSPNQAIQAITKWFNDKLAEDKQQAMKIKDDVVRKMNEFKKAK